MTFDRHHSDALTAHVGAPTFDLFPGKSVEKQTRRDGVSLASGEYWSSKQRQSKKIHEISYRACFKAELPRYFIERFTAPGEIVFDPFSGRGTTVIEAALLGRNVISNDINPLSKILVKPRLNPPALDLIKERLNTILLTSFSDETLCDIDLSMFFHEKTLKEIELLKNWFIQRESSNTIDATDEWIRMVATNRLTGHSPGFLSVYTLPPNQAVSAERQILINKKYEQKPEYRNTSDLIIKKSKQLVSDLDETSRRNLIRASAAAQFMSHDAIELNEIKDNSISLVVTSPPFLDIVQYAKDNWLRCWFNNIDAEAIGRKLTIPRTVEAWSATMQSVINQLARITKPGGLIAFEVGEVRKGTIKLENQVIPLGIAAGLELLGVMVNNQNFTKTAHIWGITNNHNGTNSNRIILFVKKSLSITI